MIIGFAGKAGSGKTTAARYLLDHKDIRIVILPMAAMLREEIEAFLREVGAQEGLPLVYGDQDDKLKIFSVDREKALNVCPEWSQFVAMNAEIQVRSDQTAVTIRRLLQWWGTEYRRAQDPDYWTKAWERKLAGLNLDETHVLVDDVRFINELETLKKHGGFFIRIVRPGFNGANDHSSENSLDNYADWDLVIENDGSLTNFKQQLDEQLLAKLIS